MKRVQPSSYCAAFVAVFVMLTITASGAEIIRVPASIPTRLDADVTEALNAFLETVPDGATVEFPEKSAYRIEGTVLLKNRRGITLDGRGATFQATDPMPDYEKSKDYSGWRMVRTRSQWRVQDCEGIVLRNMRVIGAHDNSGRAGDYDYNREAQHAFDLLGVTNVLVEAVHVSDVFGDGVYISARSRGVTVRKSRIERTGRQAVAIGTAFGILIEDNDIVDSRRGLLDIEPYGEEWSCGDIRVIGNRFGDSRLLALPMGGSGAIGAVLVANNTFSGPNGTPLVMHRTKSEGVKRGPFFFVGNSGKVGGSPAPGLRFGEVAGVLIAGNRLGFTEKRKMSVLSTQMGPVGVFGNWFPGAARLAEDDVTGRLVERANAFEEGTASRAEIEVIPGGYAVRVKLDGELECVGLMRAEGKTGPELEAFGCKTQGQWSWELRQDGKVMNKAAN
jgi:hypothetical protein